MTDTFDNVSTVVGSRRPIYIPVSSDNSSCSSHPPTPPTIVSSHTVSFQQHRNRRKPSNVFKSPSVDDPGLWEGHSTPRHRVRAPYERGSPRSARASSSSDTARSSSAAPRQPVVLSDKPALPLYHPLGPLAQSLPRLDPGLFGLPSTLSIEDPDEQRDGDSSSRSRKGPNARETVDDDAQSNGTPNGAGKVPLDVPAKERNPSPRKKRGGGAKRKRRETDDGDGVFPPPPKRTRNPRGAAAANSSAPAAPSPLVGPAVVASDLVEDVPEENGDVQEEGQEEVLAPKRATRTRKPRTRPVKRRDSSGSASTATSVSISIAATTKPAADAVAPVQTLGEDEPQFIDAEAVVINGVDKHEEEETEDGPTAGPPPAQATALPDVSPPTIADEPTESIPAVDEAPPEPANVVMEGVTPTPVPPSPPPAPIAVLSPPPLSPPPKIPISMQEEREEGELSDD